MKIAKYVVLVGIITVLLSSIVFGGQIVVKTGGTAVATQAIGDINNKEPLEFILRSNGTTTAQITKSMNQFAIDDVLFVEQIGASLASTSEEVTTGCYKFKWNTASPALEIYYRDATGTVYLMAIDGVARP